MKAGVQTSFLKLLAFLTAAPPYKEKSKDPLSVRVDVIMRPDSCRHGFPVSDIKMREEQ